MYAPGDRETRSAHALDAGGHRGADDPDRRPRPAATSPARSGPPPARVYTATKGQGRLIIAVAARHARASIGPLFAPVNPQNAQSTGFTAGQLRHRRDGRRSPGSRSSCPPGSPPARCSSLSTAAVEVYEDRIGALQVVEPSVLGVQVAYAGYFAPLVIEATGIIEDHE